MGYENRSNLPLPIALFLAADDYNHNPDVVSVTKFIKPVRELILSDRVETANVIVKDPDVLDMYKSRLGSATHARIESLWLNEDIRNKALADLGVPPKSISKIKVNPDVINKGDIPAFFEKTGFKVIDGVEFRGTADFIFNYRLGDFKQTSTFSFKDKGKDFKYMLQGSIYRWIMPELIKEDSMHIVEMYLDWVRFKSIQDPVNYPPEAIVVKDIPLMSIKETDRYIRNKIKMIDDLYDAPDDQLPECDDMELWRKPPVFKYYKNPEKRDRSTGNFDNYPDALAKKHASGDVGIIVEVKSKVGACKFCSALPICGQAKRYAHSGELEL